MSGKTQWGLSCASDANDSPRGIEFLFDRHRINVAISRAQSLAIVVGSPKLGETNVSSIGQMRLVSLISAIKKYVKTLH